MATGISGDTGVDQLQAAALTPFFGGANQSLTANGYQKFPNGLIIQWGQVTTTGGALTFNLPLAFPTVFAELFTTIEVPNDTPFGFSAGTRVSNSQARIVSRNSGGTLTAYTVNWFAIGY